MSGINKVIVLGHLGQDPDVRFMPNGGAVANLSIATSNTWKDKQTGEQKEKTEWHRVVIFGKLAEIAGEYLRKGSHVYIEGKLQTRKYEKDGVDHYSTEIVVQGYGGTMQMLDGKDHGNQSNRVQSNVDSNAPRSNLTRGSEQLAQKRQLSQAEQSAQRAQAKYANENGLEDDDIPFAPIGLELNNAWIHCI